MPMTLNIGLSRKVGEANYGSRGASVHFAVEVEASLLREPNELREKIKYLFSQAKEAVEEELSCGPQEANGKNANGHANNGNGSTGSNGHTSNGNGQNSRNGRGATSAQVRAIHAIASRERVDLTARLGEDFGVSHPEDLSISDASTLIDGLKSNGTGGRR